ncbi:zinc-ribbon and DUF3426 domain-containing protein [Granulosicoccaceae sp. 1_MG-2023]|nr:zinc-ribbon and DUF3426 domain-containing protein [Granulosicoccaceae sp. 1_MG-2023]
METLQTPATVQTRCPNCQTVFELSDEVISADDPRVRCGECLTVFNSRDNLIVSSLSDDLLVDPDDTLLTPMGPARDEDALLDGDKMVFDPDDTLTDEIAEDVDLFSDEADLPEVAYLDDEEIPEIDISAMQAAEDQFDTTLFDDVYFEDEAEIIGEATRAEGDLPDAAVPPEPIPDIFARMANSEYDEAPGSDALASPDNEPDAESAQEPFCGPVQEAAEELVPETDEEPFAGPAAGVYASPAEVADARGVWLRRAVMAAVLVIGLGGLYLYSVRDSGGVPGQAACAGGDCAAAGLKDQLKVVRRTVYSHPRVADALVINVVFRNEADQAQPYPVLDISMSDIRGAVVAARQFQPYEYLRLNDGTLPGEIAAGDVVDVSLEIVDPGDNARSFELAFR